MGQIQCWEKYLVFKEEFATFLFIACMSIACATDWLFVSNTSHWAIFLAGKTWQVATRYEEMLQKIREDFRSSRPILVAKPNQESSRYRSDLLKPSSTVLKLSLLDDVLTIIPKLCLLLQSDHKDFRAIHDVVEQTLITLKGMSEDQNHAAFENLKKSPALMEKLHNFNAESIISKWLQVDNNVMVEHFYSSTTVPFIKVLTVEMKGVFSFNNLPVLRAMMSLNPDKIKMTRSFWIMVRMIFQCYMIFMASREMTFLRKDKLLVCLY